MIQKALRVAGAVVVLVLAASLVYLFQQQREQARELSRLQNCVSIIERNQDAPFRGPIMGCPIYN